MARKHKHITNPEEFQRYIDGSMSARERFDFEKNLLEDDFEQEAFEGLGKLNSDEISADLASLKNQFHAKTSKRNAWIYYRIAATILLLGIFSFAIFYFIETNTPQEIAQVKKNPAEEKVQETYNAQEEFKDSLTEDKEPIIAYQQKAQEIQKAPAMSGQKASATKSIAEKDEDLQIEDRVPDVVMENDFNENQLEEEVESFAAAEDKSADDQQVLSEIAPELTLAPAVAMKKEASEAQSRKARIASRTITGKVMSQEDEEALPGVNVIVKGTSQGTVTDIEGNYVIQVPDAKDVVLVYSIVGYSTEEVEVGNLATIDVNIEPDMTALSEIVVTGYASQTKSNVTGAVSSVTLDEENDYSYTLPKPAGGNGSFKDYVRDNLRYPPSGLQQKIKGTVKLKFTVKQNGQISGMEVVKSLGEDFDKEAMRLVNEGPDWEPAMENDSSVEKEVTVKIRFRPPE